MARRSSRVWNIAKGVITAFANLPRGLEHFQKQAKEFLSDIEELEKRAFKTKADVLYASIGRALTAWATMEELLIFAASTLLRVHSNKAGIVMYSIHNFNSWLSVIHDLFEQDPELRRFQRRFDKLSERMRRIKDTRDRLAHHSVDRETAQLVVSSMDARSKSKKQSPLEPEEVVDFTNTVLDIASGLNALVTEMRQAARMPLPDRPAGLATDPSSPQDFPPHQTHEES